MDDWTPRTDPRTGETYTNVVGRFDDHTVLDMEATRAAKLKPPFPPKTKQVVILHTKLERNALGGVSTDVSASVLKFDKCPSEALEQIREFKSAWLDYQKRRKAPLQPSELEVLRLEFGEDYQGAQPVAETEVKKEPSKIVERKEIKRRGRPRKVA